MEETKIVESGQEGVEDVISPSAIIDIKKNYVPRSSYEKLKEDYNNVVDSVLKGEEIAVEKEKEPVNIQELRDKIFKPNSGLGACEFMEAALALRDETLSTTGQDIFIPNHKGAKVSAQDQMDAEETAQFFREWLEAANGNDDDFVREIKNNVVEMNPLANIKGNSNIRRR